MKCPSKETLYRNLFDQVYNRVGMICTLVANALMTHFKSTQNVFPMNQDPGTGLCRGTAHIMSYGYVNLLQVA